MDEFILIINGETKHIVNRYDIAYIDIQKFDGIYDITIYFISNVPRLVCLLTEEDYKNFMSQMEFG